MDPVIMQRDGLQVTVRSRAEYYQRLYDGWVLVGDATGEPTDPPPVVDPPTGGGDVDLSNYATKAYADARAAERSPIGHGHSVGDIADLRGRVDKVDAATDAATGSTLVARDSAGGSAFTQVTIGAAEPLLDGHAVPLAFVRRSLAGYVTQEYFEAQTALLVRRIRDLEEGTYPEPDPGPTPATPGTFQALMGALL